VAKNSPVCVVRTNDGGVKFLTHEPIPAKIGGNVTLKLQLESQTVSLLFCKNCGVAYVDSEEITFGVPSETGIKSPQGGTA
jgi:hypothetical protein